MSDPKTTRMANSRAASKAVTPSGPDSLSGQVPVDTQIRCAVEGQISPQANGKATPIANWPAGSTTAPPAKLPAAPTDAALEGHKTSRSQSPGDTHMSFAAADDIPGGQRPGDAHDVSAAGDQVSVPANCPSASNETAPVRSNVPSAAIVGAISRLAPPSAGRWHLLRMASRELDEIESVRISTRNRIQQLVSERVDKDGKTRGYGMLPPGICDPGDKKIVDKLLAAVRKLVASGIVLPPPGWDPSVWKFANLAVVFENAEKDAVKQLEAELKRQPLWPWIEAQKGIGPKQAARLLGVIGDPLTRPEIIHDDGTIEPARRRSVSETLSYCGHGDPDRKPRKGMTQKEAFQLGNPDAKKRLRVIAMQCMRLDGVPDKNGRPRALSPYREVYDKAREEYADRVHDKECRNRKPHWADPNGCGTSQHPEWGAPGSPWRPGHQKAAALRKAGKQFIKDLYHEALRLQGEASTTPVSGHVTNGTHARIAADGPDIPIGQRITGTQRARADGENPVGANAA